MHIFFFFWGGGHTGYVEDSVVCAEWAVLPALPLPVDHDLHDLCPHGEVSGVDRYAGGGAVARLGVLTLDKQDAIVVRFNIFGGRRWNTCKIQRNLI